MFSHRDPFGINSNELLFDAKLFLVQICCTFRIEALPLLHDIKILCFVLSYRYLLETQIPLLIGRSEISYRIMSTLGSRDLTMTAFLFSLQIGQYKIQAWSLEMRGQGSCKKYYRHDTESYFSKSKALVRGRIYLEYLEICCDVTSSHAAAWLSLAQRTYPAESRRLRGSVYTFGFTRMFLQYKHVVSDQMCSRPHNKMSAGRKFHTGAATRKLRRGSSTFSGTLR
jgi:hypothetical protein